MVKPILWSGAKTVGRATLRTGGKILSDMADNSNGTPAGDIVAKHARELIGKLKGGGGRKRKAKTTAAAGVLKKVKRAAAKKPKRTTPKRTYRDIFA
jgi:hypothetical protein